MTKNAQTKKAMALDCSPLSLKTVVTNGLSGLVGCSEHGRLRGLPACICTKCWSVAVGRSLLHVYRN